MFNIGHIAVTYLNCISIRYLTQSLVFWKLFVDYIEKLLPYVWSHISTIGWIVPNNISRSISPLVVSLGCCRWCISELMVISTFVDAFLVLRWGFLKDPSSDDISERCLLIDSGMFFKIPGGWLDLLWIYWGTLLGLTYGIYFPLFKSKVTSRKWTVILLASIVILRPWSLKMAQRSFLISSIFRGGSFEIHRPSSL